MFPHVKAEGVRSGEAHIGVRGVRAEKHIGQVCEGMGPKMGINHNWYKKNREKMKLIKK